MILSTDLNRLQYMSFNGRGGKKLLHFEPWSNPDAETFITGVNYYDNPQKCRRRMNELYTWLGLPIPENNEPIPQPIMGGDISSDPDAHTVRWGDSQTATFQHGEMFFKNADDVFSFSPLEHANFTGWKHVVVNWDFSSEEAIYNRLRKDYPAEWGVAPPDGVYSPAGFYNTMFMWPMLTFGWELFLECCMDDRFERIMDEFAEINRRVFKAIARLPVNFVHCHDDIVMTRGPVCSPDWMRMYIFPRYEEFWGLLKAAGKQVIFIVDGCVDVFVDDIMACGAKGIVSEPYTDYKSIARKYKDCVLAGEGDNQVLNRNNPSEIRAMVESMVETGQMSGGYMMGIGNHIPWNVNPEGIKRYLDLSAEIGYRL